MPDSTIDEILTARFIRTGICPVVTTRLATDDFSQVVTVAATLTVATAEIERLMAKVGTILDSGAETTGIVRTGFLRMNPTVIRIRCLDAGDGTTSIDVRASAKEGLIRQHGGHQAVHEFIGRLTSLTPTEATA